ncbi:MAG: hypothetical protein KAU99_02075 [Thermoplasmata archaeon]|nr:hypothetical protein [Thermoplasmata archaeon]
MMWARNRELATAFVLLSVVLSFQPTASGEVWTCVPIDNFENGNAGLVVLEVHESYVTINLSTSDPDVIHIPVFVLPDGDKVAKATLEKASQEQEVLMPLALDTSQEEDRYVLVLDQDWPQEWDELIIELSDQDWPQYGEAIIPLAFQDWPQSWLPAELV